MLNILQDAIGINQTFWSFIWQIPAGFRAGRWTVPDPQAKIGLELIPLTFLGIMNFVKSWNHLMLFAIWPLQAVERIQMSVFFSFKGCRRVRIAILESSAGVDVPASEVGAILAMFGSVLTLQGCQGQLWSGSALICAQAVTDEICTPAARWNLRFGSRMRSALWQQ